MSVAMTLSGTIGWFVVTSGQPVIDVVFWRCVFGGLTLLVVCSAMGLLKKDAMTRNQLIMAIVSAFAILANWLLLFAAYPLASISISTTLYNTQPFMLVLLGAVFFKEKLTVTKFFWLGMAFCGVLLLLQAKDAGTTHTGSSYILGVSMALASAFCYAVAATLIKKLNGVAPILIVLVHVLVGVLALGSFANLTDLPASPAIWMTLGTIGVVHTGLVFILLYGAIQKLPTHLTGALSFIYPLVAFLVDIFAFGHHLQLIQIIGAIAILLAAAATTLGWTPLNRKQIPE